MLLVMLCAQSAIGVTNDYCDRDLDAASKPWKPIVAGVVRPRDALILAGLLIVAAAALAATLGLGSFGLAMLGMGCGLAYDVRLKRTIWSALPFMVAIPVLPAWVWLTLGAWEAVLWWLLPLGALIGLALHLANTLPDIDADAAYGIARAGASARRAEIDVRGVGVVRCGAGAERGNRADRGVRRTHLRGDGGARGAVPRGQRRCVPVAAGQFRASVWVWRAWRRFRGARRRVAGSGGVGAGGLARGRDAQGAACAGPASRTRSRERSTASLSDEAGRDRAVLARGWGRWYDLV